MTHWRLALNLAIVACHLIAINSAFAIGSKEGTAFEEYRKFREAGKLSDATVAARKWAALVEAKHGPTDIHTADSLLELGSFYRAIGQYKEAIPLINRSWKIHNDRSGPEDIRTVACLEELALLYIDIGNPDRALKAAEAIVAKKREQIDTELPKLDEAARLEFLKNLKPYDIAASLGSGPAVAEAVILAKGIVLERYLQERRTFRSSQNASDEVLQDRIDAMLGEIEAESEGAIKRSLQFQLDRLQMSRRSVSEASSIGNSKSVTTKKVSSALTDDMALIEYLNYNRYLGKEKWESSYGAVILRPGHSPAFIHIGPAREIDREITSYREAIESVGRGEIDDQKVLLGGQKLYRWLIETLGVKLGGISRFVICPDGALSFVPFSALIDQRGEFFGEKGIVYYVASGRDLIPRDGIGDRVKGSPLIMGDPEYGTESESQEGDLIPDVFPIFEGMNGNPALFSPLVFSPLPGTRGEKARIAKIMRTLFPKVEAEGVKLGIHATEKEIRDTKSPVILHLATHGFFLTGEEEGESIHSMMRSGLALRGAQVTADKWKRGEFPDSDNDGILLAAEVSDLDLRGTELVVLSACQTAIAETVPGEGVLGMRRAFAMAGSRNVLMTLWDIADEPTASFMSDFYARYQSSSNAPRVLAEVQRDWLIGLRQRKGIAMATYLASPFVMSAQTRRAPVNTLGMKFVEVPGTNVMMSIWETRIRDYAIYAAEKPRSKGDRLELWLDGDKENPDFPVGVVWNDAKAFCDWLGKKEGLPYRLPTDHEWSLAVGIGRSEKAEMSPAEKHLKIRGIYPWGTEWPPPRGAGNFANYSGQQNLVDFHPAALSPVGSYSPNPLGIFDLAGNVSEWCEDLWRPDSLNRVFRGSSYSDDDPEDLLSSFRDSFRPSSGGNSLGFRCVLEVDLD